MDSLGAPQKLSFFCCIRIIISGQRKLKNDFEPTRANCNGLLQGAQQERRGLEFETNSELVCQPLQSISLMSRLYWGYIGVILGKWKMEWKLQRFRVEGVRVEGVRV